MSTTLCVAMAGGSSPTARRQPFGFADERFPDEWHHLGADGGDLLTGLKRFDAWHVHPYVDTGLVAIRHGGDNSVRNLRCVDAGDDLVGSKGSTGSRRVGAVLTHLGGNGIARRIAQPDVADEDA